MRDKLVIETLEHHSSHNDYKKIPENPTMPQVAFCGRSNSGKSSLINALLGRKGLVKVSSTPGKTQSLNFFLLNKKIFLVDLPGFGYAKASNKTRDYLVEVVNGYLNNAETLRLLFILCDSSRDLPEEELNLIDTCFKKEITPILVRTKTDKLNQKERERLKKESKQIRTEFPDLKILPISVKKLDSIIEVRNIIAEI
ncbi:MAG: YihA family ribosome biogenesis GTP-binding protein [Leptospiraceae bacterium]|nr:YihA family ribosome biogenesis GTP-binding protein [Leptospiraceae bacterium]